MKMELIVYTEINGQRNSLDTAHTDIDSVIREIKKALLNGKNIQVIIKR